MDQGIDDIFNTYANGAIIPGPTCTSGYQQTDSNRSQVEFTVMGLFPGKPKLAITDIFNEYNEPTNYTRTQSPCSVASSFHLTKSDSRDYRTEDSASCIRPSSSGHRLHNGLGGQLV